MSRNLKELIRQMTLEEKAGLCSGADFWNTMGIERLGIPSVMMTDGPHGLRKQEGTADHLGLNKSVNAVCFPAACATASSFDVELMERMGQILGDECQAENVSMLLGPAVNIKRSPLCGRNFEYMSEDPYLTGKMASAYIRGVQSKGIGTSMKHFAANNQETDRMQISSEVSERAFREIYLPAFEEAVKKAYPKTVMCSYNKINGVFSSENKKLLTDILRDEWGFEGYVVSDWGAVNDRVKGLKAGLDLEMPGSGGYNTRKIIQAVENGELEEEILDRTVERILKVVFSYTDNRKATYILTFTGGINKVLSENLLSEHIEFKPYTTKDGLPSDLVQSMIEDKEGSLWVISENALTRFNPEKETFEYYDKKYMQQELYFTEAAPVLENNQLLSLIHISEPTRH